MRVDAIPDGKPMEPSDAEKEMARFLQISIGELRALGQGGDGRAYAEAKARREAKERAKGKV